MVCPVVNITTYVKLADLMNIKLREGSLFCATDPKDRVSSKPFVGSTVTNRLRLHPTTLKIHEGETIFIDKIGPKWPRAIHELARFFSKDPRNTHGY